MKGGLFFEYLLLWKRQRILILHIGSAQVSSPYLCLIFEKYLKHINIRSI